jgi:hypothetical protein
MPPLSYSTTTNRLIAPSPQDRAAALAAPPTAASHQELMMMHRDMFERIEQLRPSAG